MGIPGFYRFLNNSPYGRFFYPSARLPVHILAIDMNGVIHQVAQEKFEYGKFSKSTGVASIPLSREQYLQKVGATIEGVWLEVKKMIQLLKPTDQLIMAVDGVAPQSKIVQQRKRRYMAALNRDPTQSFDSNQITPGTVFMDTLDRYLQKQLEDASKNPQLKSLFPRVVTYSSHRVPGEGEHKIADIIRSLGPAVDRTLVIDGLDADLFMIYLPLTLNFANVYLRRSNPPGADRYLHLTSIAQQYNNPYDLIVKSFFIGNDFLPRFPGFDNIDTLLQKVFLEKPDPKHIIVTYSSHPISASRSRSGTSTETRSRSGTSIETHELVINWANLEKWLEYLEPLYMKELSSWAQRAGGYVSASFEIKQRYGGEETQRITTWDPATFRRVWYEHAFAPMREQPLHIDFKDEEAMVESYLKGLNWVFQYYRRGYNNVDPLWYYPYHYAPVFEDLARYIRRMGDQVMNVKTAVPPASVPLSSSEQLVMVLPPKSKEFVPSRYQVLYTVRSPIVDYFPETFKIDSTGISREFEYIPLVPIVYPYRLRAALEMIDGRRIPDEKVENKEYLFV